jgi:hypothetical protein
MLAAHRRKRVVGLNRSSLDQARLSSNMLPVAHVVHTPEDRIDCGTSTEKEPGSSGRQDLLSTRQLMAQGGPTEAPINATFRPEQASPFVG